MDYVEIINNIKNEITNTNINVTRYINSNMILMYYRIGKIIYENSEYGNGFIKKISNEIKKEYLRINEFSVRNLKYMKKFYSEYKDFDEKVQQAVAQLPWGHNIIIMEKIEEISTRMIYINATIENGWSRNILSYQIENLYHKRIGKTINNFKETLPKDQSKIANDILKDPYVFSFITLDNNYKEQELEKKLVDKIKNVLLELGNGFSFVGNQYKLVIDNQDYYIDLLFYHLKIKSYIVVELKITEFKSEYIGKMNFYLSAVDDLIKGKNDNSTIGLIICKYKNKITAKYSLRDVNKPIGISTYIFNNYLPSEKELNEYFDFN